jgi:hypothetical protein
MSFDEPPRGNQCSEKRWVARSTRLKIIGTLKSRTVTYWSPVETTMKLQQLVVLACALLALSACVVEPYGGGNPRGYYYSGGYGEHDYGRRAWQQ